MACYWFEKFEGSTAFTLPLRNDHWFCDKGDYHITQEFIQWLIDNTTDAYLTVNIESWFAGNYKFNVTFTNLDAAAHYKLMLDE